MTVFLITYDLNREVVRPKVLDRIKALPEWARLSESSYAVNTMLTADQLFDHFKDLLDQNDNFTIVKLSRPMAGVNRQEIANWLQQKLTW